MHIRCTKLESDPPDFLPMCHLHSHNGAQMQAPSGIRFTILVNTLTLSCKTADVVRWEGLGVRWGGGGGAAWKGAGWERDRGPVHRMFTGMHYNAGGGVGGVGGVVVGVGVFGGGLGGGGEHGRVRGGRGAGGLFTRCSQVCITILEVGSEGWGCGLGVDFFFWGGEHGRVRGGRGAGGLFTRCSEVCITMLEVGW